MRHESFKARFMNSIQIWTSAAFHPVYRCGGWATVRGSQSQPIGAVGGERNTDALRMALAGLAAALRALPRDSGAAPNALIEIRTTSPELAVFSDLIRDLDKPGRPALPDDNLDLWAQILTASVGRRLALLRAPPETDKRTAFTFAWAELARDKAKATGPFTAAIPKTNLAKVSWTD